MATQVIKHPELDGYLDRLAQDPDRFLDEARLLAAQLDAKGIDLEITNPSTWRKPVVPLVEVTRASVENQLRAEIDSILILDRVAEARLARRIEFARLRLESALAAANMTGSDLDVGISHRPAAYLNAGQVDCTLPPKVCRRWSELHALRTEMVERNLYLVLINVERYAHTTAGRADLIQEGSASLFRAVDGFDWRRGLLFRTYAVHWLNQAFRSYLYNFGSTVRLPVYLQKAMKHINQAIVRLGNQHATVEEIAREAKLGENLVSMALSAARSSRSIDSPLGDSEDGASLQDVLRIQSDTGPYSTDLEDTSLEEGLAEALERLSDRERLVINLRFGLGTDRAYTLAEVAHKLGVSLERVRQIQVRAITKMRTPKLRKTVDPYLN